MATGIRYLYDAGRVEMEQWSFLLFGAPRIGMIEIHVGKLTVRELRSWMFGGVEHG